MAEFGVGEEHVDGIRNGDGRQIDPDVPAQLDALRSLVDRAVQSRDLAQEVGVRLAATIDAANSEAHAPRPRVELIIAELGEAEKIAASAPTVVTAIDGVLMTLTG